VFLLFLIFRNKQILFGSLIALVLYTPLLSGMTSDPQLQGSMFRLETLTQTAPEVFRAFLSGRWLFLLALPLLVYAPKRKYKLIANCLLMLIAPFILFFAKGGTIYGRMLLPTLPFFCLLLGSGLDRIKYRHITRAVVTYCLICFTWGVCDVDRTLKADITQGGMKYGRVSLGCSYWYERYAPRELIEAWDMAEKLPIVFPLIDKAASPLYWYEFHSLSGWKPERKDLEKPVYSKERIRGR